jgi:hypothetical protein
LRDLKPNSLRRHLSQKIQALLPSTTNSSRKPSFPAIVKTAFPYFLPVSLVRLESGVTNELLNACFSNTNDSDPTLTIEAAS